MSKIERYEINEQWAHSGIVKAGDFCFLIYCVGNIGGTIEEQINGAFDNMDLLHPHDRPGARAEEEIKRIEKTPSRSFAEAFSCVYVFKSSLRQAGGGPSSA